MNYLQKAKQTFALHFSASLATLAFIGATAVWRRLVKFPKSSYLKFITNEFFLNK